jgi:hypothetical protein
LPKNADETSGAFKKEIHKMKNRFVLASVLSAFAFTGVANAQVSGSGTMGISASIAGSILLTFVTDASGMTVTGTTTSTASLPLSTIKMYGGTVPGNVTKQVFGTSSFTVSTPFDVLVNVANDTTTNYTLSVTLSTTDPTNTWTLGGTDITDGSAHTLAATGAYATQVPYTLVISIPASEAAFTLGNSISFTATAN